MNRRRFLQCAGLAGGVSTTGCLSQLGFETRPGNEPPIVENRPDAVYYPSHVEGMEMAAMGEAGPYQCAVTYSFPHRFWLVTGQDRERVDVESDDSLHLMLSLWDAETGVVPPSNSLDLAVERDGETVAEKPPWPMLSQNMGFHFGDNVALTGDGTYTANVRVGPLQTRRTGAFRDRFGEAASASLEFEFSQGALDELRFEELQNRGVEGAVEPMEMEMMPLAQLPEPDGLPGRQVGEATSGDGRFVVTALDEPPAGVEASGTYLAVSARTPYNRYPLPFMGLSATLTRDGDTVFDDALTPTLDPDLDYHYGATVDGVESGDALELSVGAPPQVARHEGYETAFFDMQRMELTV
jgi:hypothetical protein